MKWLWWLMPVIVLGSGSCNRQSCGQLLYCVIHDPNESSPAEFTVQQVR